MTDDNLKSIADQLVTLYTCYQSTVDLMNEHSPETHIFENLNSQFRGILDELDNMGVIS